MKYQDKAKKHIAYHPSGYYLCGLRQDQKSYKPAEVICTQCGYIAMRVLIPYEDTPFIRRKLQRLKYRNDPDFGTKWNQRMDELDAERGTVEDLLLI